MRSGLPEMHGRDEELRDADDALGAASEMEAFDGAVLWPVFRTAVIIAFIILSIIAVWQEMLMAPRANAPAAPAAEAPAVDDDQEATEEEFDGSRELVVTAGSRGHFTVRAWVNGTEVPFLVDTGASRVFLRPEDAESAGVNLDMLEYSERYDTANGVVRGAPVRLREVRVGQLTVRDVEATVSRSRLPISLLGMSFLSRLNGYEVHDGALILRW